MINISLWVQQFDDLLNVIIECSTSLKMKNGGDFSFKVDLKGKQVNFNVEDGRMKVSNGQLVCKMATNEDQFEFDYMDSDEDNLFPISVYINSEFEQSLVGIQIEERDNLGIVNHILSDKSEIN